MNADTRRQYGGHMFTVVADRTGSAGSATELVAATANTKIIVLDVEFSNGHTVLGAVQLLSGASTALTGKKYLAVSGGGFAKNDCWYKCADGAALNFTSTIDGNHSITVTYAKIPVKSTPHI